MIENGKIQIILEEILEELTENAKHISSSSLEKFANEIIKARHIFVAGAGRSGFVARGFANRLMHLGLEVFFVGEPTTPAIEKKDLLIISSGSGETDSLIVMANKAKKSRSICCDSNNSSGSFHWQGM